MKKSVKHKTTILLLSAVLSFCPAVSSYAARPSDINIQDIQDTASNDYEVPDAPYNLWWSGNRAHWDEVDTAASYKVVLYRDGSEVDSAFTDKTHHGFGSCMEDTGNYTFRVVSIDDNKICGPVSESSDTRYVSGYASRKNFYTE